MWMGLMHDTTRTVYQYHGCYWHGHATCQGKLSADQRESYKRTMAMTTRNYRALGYNVVEMWGCEWHEEQGR